MNPYDELGVPTDATIDQINAAYRRKARKAHPDAGGTEEAFERLSRSVTILRDPDARSRFDQTGETEGQQPDARTVVVEVLVGAFQKAIAQSQNLPCTDIISLVKIEIANMLAGLATNRANAEREQRRVATALDRLSHKGGGPDFVRRVLEDQAAAIGRGIAQMDATEANLRAAREMASEYDWRRDAPPPPEAPDFGLHPAAYRTGGSIFTTTTY